MRDLVISREGDDLFGSVSVSSLSTSVSYRNDRLLLLGPTKELDQLVDLYDSTLRGMINKHAHSS